MYKDWLSPAFGNVLTLWLHILTSAAKAAEPVKSCYLEKRSQSTKFQKHAPPQNYNPKLELVLQNV